MVCRKAREAARFLRQNKVCGERRTKGDCQHEGCRFAVESAEAIESLIAENESLRASPPPPLRIAA